MEGLADFYLRKLITQTGGYDLVITEFVRVTDQLLPEHVFLKQAPELNSGGFTASNTPTRLQLLGNNPDALAANAVRAVEMGSHGIDLNFGCPSKTVNNSKGGAVLLKEPETIYKIVSSVKNALPSDQITSAKMRLGYEDNSLMLDCAHAIADAGAKEITVHARTKIQGYTPPAFWHLVADFQQKLGIPVIINGEIWTTLDALQAVKEANCQNIMLGRGAIRQPWLASHIKAGKEGIEDWTVTLRLVDEFWSMITEKMSDRYCSGRLKQWLKFLRDIYPEADKLFIDIRKLTDTKEITQILSKQN